MRFQIRHGLLLLLVAFSVLPAGMSGCHGLADIIISAPCLVNDQCLEGRVCRHNTCVESWEYSPCRVDSDCRQGAVDAQGRVVGLVCRYEECVRVVDLSGGAEEPVALSPGAYELRWDERGSATPWGMSLDRHGLLTLDATDEERTCQTELSVQDYLSLTELVSALDLLSINGDLAPEADPTCEESVWIPVTLFTATQDETVWNEHRFRFCHLAWSESDGLIALRQTLLHLADYEACL